MKKLFISLIILSTATFHTLHAQKLVKIWETPPSLKTPESVIYCQANNLIYVSNINGNASEKDGNGFISVLSADGDILNLEWATGLHAPKGMGLREGKLYVADIDQLVVIDLKNGKIINRFEAPGAQFLNDVTVSPEGKVFVSDMVTKKIHMLHDNNFSEWLYSEIFNRPNGLYAEDGKLYVGDHHIFEIDMSTRKINIAVAEAGGVDGLEKTAGGDFIFSHWAGRVFLHKDGETLKLLDTSEQNINSADIGFATKPELLLVPTFFDNRIIAYKIDLE
jgi:sugar lactone lactonase YvrE